MTVTQVCNNNNGGGGTGVGEGSNIGGSSSSSFLSSSTSSSYIELVDHVKVYSNKDAEEGIEGGVGGGDVSCFCLNEIQHLIQEWSVPDIEGYIDQTVMSLEQLRDYVEFGGQRNVHRYTMQ